MRRALSLASVGVCCLAPAVHAAGQTVGKPAPEFTATTFGGKQVKLSDLKGDVVVLNFWATWCGPCQRELPMLETAFRGYAKYGFQVVAVASPDSVDDAKLKPLAAKLTIPFIRRFKGPYRDLGGYPTNFVIDRSGKLVYARAAAFNLDSLNKLVVPLLKEPLPPDPSAAPSADQAAPAAQPPDARTAQGHALAPTG